MELILGIAAVCVIVVSFFLAGCTPESKQVDGTPVKVTSPATDLADPAPDDIRQRLQQLASSPVPTELSVGAMCYEMAAPPARFDYICPACGAKTVHARAQGEPVMQWELESCRRVLKEIKGLDIKLTETGFCAKCDPGVKKPILGIRIDYGKGKVHTVSPVTSEDLQLIQEFMAGKDKHVADQGRELPLKNYTKRLSELLGTGVIGNK